jgi:DNA-binding beta-propeller fold protein YncE
MATVVVDVRSVGVSVMSDLSEPVYNEPPKWLRKLVYIMGIILLLLFLGLVAGIIYKAKNKVTAVPPEMQELGIGLPPDEKFSSAVLTGDKLTITAGRTVYVIDVPSHRVVLRVNGLQD